VVNVGQKIAFIVNLSRTDNFVDQEGHGCEHRVSLQERHQDGKRDSRVSKTKMRQLGEPPTREHGLPVVRDESAVEEVQPRQCGGGVDSEIVKAWK
jgi:hypothetical protein